MKEAVGRMCDTDASGEVSDCRWEPGVHKVKDEDGRQRESLARFSKNRHSMISLHTFRRRVGFRGKIVMLHFPFSKNRQTNVHPISPIEVEVS